MLKKIKTLHRTITATKVLRGSRIFFVFYFLLTHGLNSLRRHAPRTADAMTGIISFFIRYTPKATSVFVIKNETGIFEVLPLNDSMTISADYFESELLPWLARPKQKRTLVDIGAHMGRYTILACTHFHYTKVVAIEANPATFAMLKKNVELNGITADTILAPVAVGDRAGIVRFETDKNNMAVARVVIGTEAVRRRNHNKAVLDVQTQKASAVLDTHRIRYEEIDFIKMDVEGFEAEVLEGMKEVLQKMPAGAYIMIEISNPKNKKAQNMLESYAFTLVENDSADYLYVKIENSPN
jgi:FkbM family methyltransferase